MSEKLHSRLYEIYSRGSRIAFGFKRRVTLLGWFVIAVFPVVGALTTKFPRSSFFQLLALVGAVVVVSAISHFLRKARVKVVREIPQYATAGEVLSYTVKVSNIGALPLNNYLICEQAPDPTPSKELFLNSTEPGEELRNSFDRKFIAYRWMWMLRRRLLLTSSDWLGKPVAVGETLGQNVEFTPIRRGVITLDNLQVVLPDPVGIFQRLIKVEQEEDVVTVLPKRYRFQGVDFTGESQNQVGGDVSSSVAGQSGEFVSLREYRPGDPIKHMHWPSWGKSGKPVIKVYEDQFFPRYGLVLDTFVSVEHEAVFEVAVSLAATFACAVDTEQSLLDLMFVQQSAQIHRVGRNVDQVDSMLEVLASVDMESEPDWKGLSSMVAQHADDMTTCIAVMCSLDDERRAFLERVVASGVRLCVLLVTEGEEATGVSSELFEVHHIPVSNVEGSLAELSALG